MSNEEKKYPLIQKTLKSFIEDEEGNIPAKKLLSIGSLIILLGAILSIDVFAAHGSHKSHSSHSSHSSSSYHRSHGSHSNSHSSHASSHGSHASHTSHSNTISHSNANYSAGGDYGTPVAPSAGSITPPSSPNTLKTNIPDPIDFSEGTIAITQIQSPQNTPNLLPKNVSIKNVPKTPVAVDEKAKQSILYHKKSSK